VRLLLYAVPRATAINSAASDAAGIDTLAALLLEILQQH
jgi:hypothetical protein